MRESKEFKQMRAKTLYDNIVSLREALEQTWRDCSQLTLPYVFPDKDNAESNTLVTPYNSIGSSSVNALASKLLVALLPPSGTFFRLLPDINITKDLTTEQETQLDSELSQIEQDTIELINQQALRVPVYEAVKLLIVTGNTMLYKVPNGAFKVFSPYQYVVQRDYVGDILYSVIKEKMSWETIPLEVQKQLLAKEQIEELEVQETNGKYKQVTVYTAIVRDKNKFRVWQEIAGIRLKGTEKVYAKDALPYIILRWSTVNNESYGRGLVEQYLGDFRSLEGLTQTIVEGAGISAMTLFGVRPASTIKVEDLNNAANGQFILGDLEREISTLQVGKSADLQVPLNLLNQLEQRISKAFLMLSGQVRDSERTTATEVRATVAELESTLGGIFSVLANEFQKPLISLLLKEQKIDVDKVAVPSITTGIGAISRERDFQNLNTMLQATAQLGQGVLEKYLKVDSYLAKVATALGMQPDEIVKSKEEIQAFEQQQAQLQQQQQVDKMQVEGFKQGLKGD